MNVSRTKKPIPDSAATVGLSIRVDADLVRQIDTLAEVWTRDLRDKGLAAVTRADVVRAFIRKGLEAA